MAERKLYDNNITPYITAKVHTYIQDFINKDSLIYVSGRTVRYFHQTNDERARKLPVKIGMVAESFPHQKEDDSGETVVVNNTSHTFIVVPETHDSKAEIEILDVLNHCTYDYIEKAIIKLRTEGYTFEEIAPIVGFSKSAIGKILRKIEERFDLEYKKAK